MPGQSPADNEEECKGEDLHGLRGIAAAATVALVVAAPAAATDPMVVPGEGGGGGGGCKTTVTDGSSDAVWMRTEVFWCWDGRVVTTASPSTSHGEDWRYLWEGLTTDSYCCVGQSTWSLTRVGRWENVFVSNAHLCVRNELHLNGNGSYSTNPGEYVC